MQDQSSSRRVPFGYRWTKGRLVAEPRSGSRATSVRQGDRFEPGGAGLMVGPQASKAPAILYARTARNDACGSIRRQLTDCQALAQREGLTVIADYSDQGVAGHGQSHGPQLAAALRHAEELGASLIVQHSDRLARRTERLLELKLAARQAGIRLRSVQDTALRGLVLTVAAVEGARRSATAKAGLARRRHERAGEARP